MNNLYKRVRGLFNYRLDGMLIWKASKGRAKKGNVAGTIDSYGYFAIQVDGELYRAHRLVWLWHHSHLPENNLDHINRIKSDNRIKNLREASQQCNRRNTGNPNTNKSGVKGVYKHPSWSVWQAGIRVSSKNYHLGTFDDFGEAVLTRLAAEQCLNWEGCDSSSPAYKYALEHKLIKLTLTIPSQ